LQNQGVGFVNPTENHRRPFAACLRTYLHIRNWPVSSCTFVNDKFYSYKTAPLLSFLNYICCVLGMTKSPITLHNKSFILKLYALQTGSLVSPASSQTSVNDQTNV
jgi:hypothetical protein